MTTLFTFPGQGTQKAGMLHSLMAFEVGRELVERANDHLHEDVLALDTREALSNNRNTQLALTICSYAYAEILRAHAIEPDYVLGLSIGAFPAAISARCLRYEHGLSLVAQRGELMANAYPEGYSMAAIIGLSLTTVQELIEQAAQTNHVTYIANINTPTQIVVSGNNLALEYLCALALQKQATRAHRLNVNVPSHCALLAEQAEQFADAFTAIPFDRPTTTYVSANAARVLYPPARIHDDLIHNMARQVHWWETVAMLKERGVTLAIEISPGSVLTGLCKASMPDTISIALDNENLSNLEALVRRYG